MGACSSSQRSFPQTGRMSFKRNSSLNRRERCREMSDRWEIIKTYGKVPCERSGHAVVVHEGKAFLFGGYGGQDPAHLSDLFSYSFEKQTWRQLASSNGPCPCPRTAFAMCVSPDSYIYVWGGTDHDLQGLKDQELYEFDILNCQWKQIEACNKRFLHFTYFGRSASFYNNKIYYFGGGKSRKFTNELIEFDLEQKRWARIDTTGDIPWARYKHQACIVEDALYVIGGGCYLPPTEEVDVYVLNMKTWVWTKLRTEGQQPEGRAAHTCEYDPVTHAIYLWGGFNQSLIPLVDLYKLDLATHEWSHVTVPSKKDECVWPDRSFHASCLHEGALYSYSGSDAKGRYSDLMKFQVHQSPLKLVDLALLAVQSSNNRNVKLPEEIVQQLHAMEPPKRCPTDPQTIPYS